MRTALVAALALSLAACDGDEGESTSTTNATSEPMVESSPVDGIEDQHAIAGEAACALLARCTRDYLHNEAPAAWERWLSEDMGLTLPAVDERLTPDGAMVCFDAVDAFILSESERFMRGQFWKAGDLWLFAENAYNAYTTESETRCDDPGNDIAAVIEVEMADGPLAPWILRAPSL